MSRLIRVGSCVFALCIIVSLLATAAWGGGGGISPGRTVTAASGDGTALPPGASEDWWSSVQEQIRQSEYYISWQESTDLPDLAATYQAPNRAQNLRTYFTESGIRIVPRADSTAAWNLGLKLTGYCYQGDSRPVAAAEMAVEENRADYDRGDVAEWYVNTEEGLEQGFTLNASPSGAPADTLVLELSLSGNLTPTLGGEGQAVEFITPGGVRVLRYADLKVNDARGRLLNSSLSLSGDRLFINIDAASAVFPITVDPLLTTPGWTAEGEQDTARFGGSVATAGDVNGDGYSDVIVGAYDRDNGEVDEGLAYAYLGSATGLSSIAAWTAESNQVDANFGWSVATAGDVNGDGYSDVIVGSTYYDNGLANEGGAFVYYGSASGLGDPGTPANADWTAESNQADAYFGYSVASAGDVNGDGYSDIIVTATDYDNGIPDEGMAFVYHGSASGLGDSGTPANADWTAESNQGGAMLGTSAATAGDVNGDSYADVIVGAWHYSNGEAGEGAAFVWRGSSTGLGTSGTPANAYWSAESNQVSANLGYSVGTAGDVNGDGYADVIVGAHFYDAGVADEGIALVWHGSTTGLGDPGIPANAVWSVEGNQFDARLGGQVGTAGDVDGDGYADVIVGARLYDNGETDEGIAGVYRGSSVGLDDTPLWVQEGNQGSAGFGNSAATAGDVDGDGYADVIVGAYVYDSGQTDEGRAYVYHGYASGLMALPLWGAESNQPDAHFGFSAGTAGDVNGDGYADVVVGALNYDGGESYEGRAYVYYGSAAGLNLTAARTLEINVEYSQFGYSVGTAGDVNGDGYDDVIIGANVYDNGVDEIGEGATYVYYGSAAGLEPTYGWRVEGNATNAQFGYSVGTAGDVNGDGYADVIIGAAYYQGTYAEEGRAYVFHGSAAGLDTTASWTVDGSQEHASFGCRVSTAGDVNRDGYADVIVGAYGFSNGETFEGKAFVYHGSAGGLSTTPAWSKESNQASAQFGRAVSTAGDVNGDGYSDVVVGSWNFTNGQDGEGAAFVYHGSASGLSTTQAWFAESNQTYASFGCSVDTAGDVNGDGYADVVVGAHDYTNGETDEGAAAVYLGSADGLSPILNWIADGNQASAEFGRSVGAAGDVNGDGYSDVIVGADYYDYGEASEGAAFLYYGGGRCGVSLNPQQVRSDSSAPIAHLGQSDQADAFRLTINVRTPFGRGKAKLQCEVKPLGTAFDGTGLRESGTWTSSGSEISYLVDGLSSNTVYHWRMRLHYSSATIPFQQYSRWVTMPWNGWQEADLRTAAAPEVTTNDATNVTVNSATLNGNLTSLGTATSVTVSFEYGTTSGGPYTSVAVAEGVKTGPGTFYAELSGLTAGTMYYFRAKAEGVGTGCGVEKSFTAGTTPPVVTSGDATYVTDIAARLNGSLTSMGTATTVSVSCEWGTAPGSYSSETESQAMSGTGDFNFNLSGLTPGTTYFFRAKAAGAGMGYGDEESFTTATTPDATAPSTPQVTDDGQSTAKTTEIHAAWSSTDDESGIVEYSYAVGTSPGGNDVVDWTSAGTATEKTITGLTLTPGQTYYVSVKALNGQGLWSDVGSSDGITVSAGEEGGVPFWVWILVALGAVGMGGAVFFFWKRRKAKAT